MLEKTIISKNQLRLMSWKSTIEKKIMTDNDCRFVKGIELVDERSNVKSLEEITVLMVY